MLKFKYEHLCIERKCQLFFCQPQILRPKPSTPPVPTEEDTLQFFDEVIASCDSEPLRKPYKDDGHADVDFIGEQERGRSSELVRSFCEFWMWAVTKKQVLEIKSNLYVLDVSDFTVKTTDSFFN